MKQIDNRQKELKQLKAQKGHLLSFRDKSHFRPEIPPVEKHETEKEKVQSKEAAPVANSEHKEKVGRNDPCPCGSGKKYKKCCLEKKSE